MTPLWWWLHPGLMRALMAPWLAPARKPEPLKARAKLPPHDMTAIADVAVRRREAEEEPERPKLRIVGKEP